jgi:hypothetical protein
MNRWNGSFRVTMSILLPLLLAFPVFQGAHGQSITVDPPLIAPVDVLTVNDIDFLHATTPKWLFTISMRAEETVQAVMSISVNIMLRDGSFFQDAVLLTTDPFDIMGSRIITNVDLANDNPHVASSSVRDDARQRLEETALPGGRIPAGLYMFTAVVTPTDGGVGTTVTFTFEPTNPTSIELLFPTDGDDNVSTYPLFQWRYDGPRARISIYEQIPGQTTLEEVISGVPHLTETTETNSFQYPSSGVRALEPGKTYVWTVDGLAGISGGTEATLRSELRTFRLSTRNALWISGLLEEIEAAVGPSYTDVFAKIRREGLAANGSIMLNGTPIPYSDLLPLLDLFRQKSTAVTKVELE